jgi:hypothetical protein
MSFTFSDQQGLLSIILGDSNTGSDDAWPLATRKKYLNRGEMQFCKDSKLVREYATGTVASSQIAFPSDMLDLYVIIIGNYIVDKTREISIKDYERFYSYTGNPPYYYVSEESGTRYFKFIGSVDGQTYKLYYFKKPSTELSGDSDVSILPEEFREASVHYAAGQLLKQVGKNTIADLHLAIYNKYVREGQELAEKLYVNKDYANPDLNFVGNSEQDIVGGGFDFA